MPRALLDTHSFLWFVTADPKLSTSAERLISAGSNELLLSIASVWEMAIKVSIGRLPIPEPLDTFIPEHLHRNRLVCSRSSRPILLKLPGYPSIIAIRSTAC